MQTTLLPRAISALFVQDMDNLTLVALGRCLGRKAALSHPCRYPDTLSGLVHYPTELLIGEKKSRCI